jgi:hypothetical protein
MFEICILVLKASKNEPLNNEILIIGKCLANLKK